MFLIRLNFWWGWNCLHIFPLLLAVYKHVESCRTVWLTRKTFMEQWRPISIVAAYIFPDRSRSLLKRWWQSNNRDFREIRPGHVFFGCSSILLLILSARFCRLCNNTRCFVGGLVSVSKRESPHLKGKGSVLVILSGNVNWRFWSHFWREFLHFYPPLYILGLHYVSGLLWTDKFFIDGTFDDIVFYADEDYRLFFYIIVTMRNEKLQAVAYDKLSQRRIYKRSDQPKLYIKPNNTLQGWYYVKQETPNMIRTDQAGLQQWTADSSFLGLISTVPTTHINCDLCALALGLALHIFATQCGWVPTRTNQLSTVSILLYRFWPCLVSRNIFHVVSALPWVHCLSLKWLSNSYSE